LASFLVAGIRWHLFLRAAGIDATRRATVAAYLTGAFANNFLPSQFGGDVTRAWIVSTRGARVVAAATVVVDRATALACLVPGAPPRPPAVLGAGGACRSRDRGLRARVLPTWARAGGASAAAPRFSGFRDAVGWLPQPAFLAAALLAVEIDPHAVFAPPRPFG